MKTWQAWVGAVVLILLVTGMFWPVLGYDFVLWDDDISVTHNPMLKGPWSWELVKSFFDPQAALRFKPLHWLVLRLVGDVAGLNPAAWHALGLALHTGAAVGVFMALSKALRMADISRDEAVVYGVAWMATAIWALHPLHVEPVAWVTGSTYPMAMLFMAWSYWAYLKAHETGVEKKMSGSWLGVAWVLAVAAYATYPVSVAYVVWLMATDGFLLRRVPSQPWLLSKEEVRRWWWKHVAFAVPAIGAVGATLWTRLLAPGEWHVAPTLGDVSWIERLATAAATLIILLGKFIWPSELTPNHAYSSAPVFTIGWVLYGAMAFLCGAILLFMGRRRYSAWIWYFAGVAGFALPCLGLTERPVWPVDRYSYALDAILIGGLAAGVLVISDLVKPRWWVGVALVLVLLTVSVSSRPQIQVWKNSHTLFAHMERNPMFGSSIVQKAHVYLFWHRQLVSEGRISEGREKLMMAYETYLAAIRDALRLGDYEQAVFFSRVMERNIGINPVIRRERAAWLLKIGRFKESEEELSKVAEALPGDGRVSDLLAELCKATGTP